MTTDCIHEYIEKHYSEERKRHTYAVCGTAKELAAHYGADQEKAETAALFHDMFRGAPEKTLAYQLKRFDMDDKYHGNPDLAHGKVAAAVMERDCGITDVDVLNAVRFHTTGRPRMTLLEKIIFIADAIAPGRDYPGLEEIRSAAFEDIDAACLLSMEGTIKHVGEKGCYLDEDTVLARDYLKKEGIDEQ